MGGAAAALGGGNALQGALGAGASEAAIPYLAEYGNNGVVAGTTLIGGLVGGGAGASTALAGTQYNDLSHPQLVALQQEIDQQCGGDASSACGQTLIHNAQLLSSSQEAKLVSDCTSGTPDACQTVLETARAYTYDPLAAKLGLQSDQQTTLGDLGNILGFHATPQTTANQLYTALKAMANDPVLSSLDPALALEPGLLNQVGNAVAGVKGFASNVEGNGWVGTNPFTSEQLMGVQAQNAFLNTGGQAALTYLTMGTSTAVEAVTEEASTINLTQSNVLGSAGSSPSIANATADSEAGTSAAITNSTGMAGAHTANAPWLDEVSNYTPGGTFLQCGSGACVSATAQNITGGAVTEEQMVSQIGEWSNAEKLANALNADNVNGGGWIGGMVSEANTLNLANSGIIGAELQAPGVAAHMVAIEPVAGSPGQFLVLDTGVGASYTVDSAWITKYVSKIVTQP